MMDDAAGEQQGRLCIVTSDSISITISTSTSTSTAASASASASRLCVNLQSEDPWPQKPTTAKSLLLSMGGYHGLHTKTHQTDRDRDRETERPKS